MAGRGRGAQRGLQGGAQAAHLALAQAPLHHAEMPGALLLHLVDKPVNAGLLIGGCVGAIGAELVQQYIRITHAAQRPLQAFHLACQASGWFLWVTVRKSVEGHPQAPRGHAHLMEGFRVIIRQHRRAPARQLVVIVAHALLAWYRKRRHTCPLS